MYFGRDDPVEKKLITGDSKDKNAGAKSLKWWEWLGCAIQKEGVTLDNGEHDDNDKVRWPNWKQPGTI